MNSSKPAEISVIIPTYNRDDILKKCLLSLHEQDYPKNKYEVIIVSDGFSSKVTEMINSLKKDHKNLIHIQQSHKGPAAARNLGIKKAQGEIISFIDDDCAADKSWLKLIAETHRDNPDVPVVGGYTFTLTEKVHVLVSQFLSTCSIETNIDEKKELIFFPTCNVSFKRWILDKYNFNEEFPFAGGEDLEFFWRLFKDGYNFVWDKNIKTTHHRDSKFSSFVKQAYIYGRGNLLVQYMHGDHPLLKELKKGRIIFWIATIVNIVKLSRFSYILGKKFIKENNILAMHKKVSVYFYFTLHKIFYITGNIAEYFRLMKKRVNGEKKLLKIPQLIILDITHSCNLECRICDIWRTQDNGKNIDIIYIKNILTQAKKLGVKEIALSGGEPLLRKDIFDIFEYARKLMIKDLGVLTNGILVEKYSRQLMPYLLDNTITLVISLDSLNPDTHNYIRNSDVAWHKTRRSLQELCLLKKNYPRVNFNIISIILNQNLEELVELVTFAQSVRANSLQFQPLLSNNLKMAERYKSVFWIGKDRLPVLDETMDKLIDFKKKNPSFIKNSINNLSLVKRYYRGTLTSKDVTCSSAKNTVLISSQGECRTCFSCYGDIRKQTLNNILESKAIIAAYEKVRKCSWPCLLPCFCDS